MLNADYRDILSAFDEAEVEHLLIGAYALAAHGHPRATGDLDLWVRPAEENADRVMRALKAFGAPLPGVSAEDFQVPDTVFQMRLAAWVWPGPPVCWSDSAQPLSFKRAAQATLTASPASANHSWAPATGSPAMPSQMPA
jgi:hypothetical protein